MPVKKKPSKKSRPKVRAKPAKKVKPPAPPSIPAPTPSAADRYRQHSARTASVQAAQSRAGRDIGEIRPIENIERRQKCRDNPELFCLTYNPAAFPLPFSQDHRDAIARIRESVTQGALYAFAMDRGKGKTTLCRMLSLWAISYALCRYLFLIGANATKAEDNLSAIKTFMRFLPLYRADFPEISQAVEHLAGIAQKATGQLCCEQPTMIEWSADRIILPTVPMPANWPKVWRLRDDGMAPTSGSVIGTSGLTGDGIRGSLLTLTTGEELRPDFVLLDDPQSAESAGSTTQNTTRTQLVSADVLGMAGPGKSIAAVMPCTVICPGDMADRILDRKLNPVWRGERRGILKSMPKNMEAWEKYFEVYVKCIEKEPPDYDAANSFYCAHRAELDEGAEASWAERKLPQEVSAIQSAMHLYHRNVFAFWSEYMNRPLLKAVGTGQQLQADKILGRVNGLEKETVPLNGSILTAGWDVGQNLLWYVVAAWEPATFTGSIISWGAWPEQDQSYFTNSDAKRTLQMHYPGTDLEAAIQAGLTDLSLSLLGREWKNEAGTPLKISMQLVDSRFKPDAVTEFCRRSPYAAILLPSMGKYIGAKSQKQWHQFEKGPGERLGHHWSIGPVANSKRAVRIASVDVNYWKSKIAEKMSMPAKNKGAISLWGTGGEDHRLFADHCCAEYFADMKNETTGRTVREWSERPDRKDQNHLWDCLVYAIAAASIQGAVLPAVQQAEQPPPAAADSKAEYERKRKEFEAKRRF